MLKKISCDADVACLKLALVKLSIWCTLWHMYLNLLKCKVLHIGYHNPMVDYSINECVLQSTRSEKDLGVVIDQNLRFTNHIKSICRKAYFRPNLIRNCFCCCDSAFSVYMFKVYIRPLLEASSVVWSPHYKFEIDTLENVQKRFTKKLLPDHCYSDRLKLLHLDSLVVRRIKLDLYLVFKIINGLVDLDVNEFFTLSPYQSTRGHRFKLQCNFSRLNVRKFFFSNRVF